MINNNTKKKISPSGFTLMEMLVSLAIFLIISSISFGVFTVLIKSQKSSDFKQQSLNEIRTMMELISRELRTGNKYQIHDAGTELCPDDSSGCLVFTNQIHNMVTYYRDNQDVLHREEQNSSSGEVTHTLLNSSKIAVKDFDTVLTAQEQGQEKITIILEVAYILPVTDTEFETIDPLILQTTITSRNYEKDN